MVSRMPVDDAAVDPPRFVGVLIELVGGRHDFTLCLGNRLSLFIGEYVSDGLYMGPYPVGNVAKLCTPCPGINFPPMAPPAVGSSQGPVEVTGRGLGN